MIRFLLDTDTVSLQERGDPAVLAHLRAVAADELAVSIVTVEEALRGRLAMLARHQRGEARAHAYHKLWETLQFFAAAHVLLFDAECEQQCAALRTEGVRVGTRDLRIAATALVHNLTLVTRNHRDFARVPGLRIEDWSVS